MGLYFQDTRPPGHRERLPQGPIRPCGADLDGDAVGGIGLAHGLLVVNRFGPLDKGVYEGRRDVRKHRADDFLK